MNDLTTSISGLKSKIETLIELHEQIGDKNKLLESENLNLKNKLEEQEIQIALLQEEKQNIIEIKSEEQNKVIIDSKLKIDELVQEIDNCLALLK